MRIEDLDGPRIKPGADADALDTLRWLGIDWDGDPLTQSADLTPYRDAMNTLATQGMVYPCDLTRAEIEAAASAPQEGSGENRFPPELRPDDRPRSFDDDTRSWRFVVPDGKVKFDDAFAGRQSHAPVRTVGDFPVWTKRGEPSYQLAVTVDDARGGVTDVVRGDDLLDSAARQTLLARALGLDYGPTWWHLPLVVGPDGRRLAKRHGDSRISTYQGRGVRPERVIGVLSGLSGGERREMDADGFRRTLDLTRMPRTPAVFGPEDEAWLTEGC